MEGMEENCFQIKTFTSRKKTETGANLSWFTDGNGLQSKHKCLIRRSSRRLTTMADLIAALTLLGHNVTLMRDFYQVARGLRYDYFIWQRSNHCSYTYDIIFTDIITLKTFPVDVLDKHRCKFWVIDAYGTEAAYNDPLYCKQHHLYGIYSSLGLKLKQFFTFYPHSPDNSFLGFAVSKPLITNRRRSSDKPIGLLYGKDPLYFQNVRGYISQLSNYLTLHATVYNNSLLPVNVENHGIVTTEQYEKLLDVAKYFIGVGLPLESTGVIQALAHGCIFLNPKLTLNQSKMFMEGKPTSRLLTSQVPYLEEMVGYPHVVTFDITNKTTVTMVLQNLSSVQVTGFIPEDFTHQGFLNRLNMFVEKQNFCEPVISEHHVLELVGPTHQSCVSVCRINDLVCEPSQFTKLNQLSSFTRQHISCDDVDMATEPYLPGYNVNTGRCVLEMRTELFSCAGEHDDIKRLCPCRNKTSNYL